MRTIIDQAGYLTALAATVVTDLDDSHLALEPLPGTKTAGWLLGHLVVTGDVARRWLGRTRCCPRDWDANFLPGTQPSPDPNDYPPIHELVDGFGFVYRDLAKAAADADSEVWGAANPYAPAREAFPTLGDFVGYLLTGHVAYHLGQLVAWRAAAGLRPRTRPDHLAA